MFSNKIKFIAHENYVNLNNYHPEPIKLNIPEWYKKLGHTPPLKTVKGCMPFLDTLTTGYLLRTAQDYGVKHNVYNENIKQNDTYLEASDVRPEFCQIHHLNLFTKQSSGQYHPVEQVEGAPFNERNKNLPVLKFFNPWIIKTSPGYSCLFVPPLNNSDDRFSIIPGIVDTDTFPNEINFPFIINGDKYPSLETIIKAGTPYVQVIPFKRESWKMEIIGLPTEKLKKTKNLFYGLKILYEYKEKYWSKKTWK